MKTILSILVTLFVITGGNKAMAGLFGTQTLFSQVSGTVVLEGEVVSGVKVVQRVKKGNGEWLTAEVLTDEAGKFEFQEVKKSKGILDLLPSELVIQQELLIDHKNEMVQGWVYTKRDAAPNTESSGKAFVLVCELSNEADFSDNYFGVCRLVET